MTYIKKHILSLLEEYSNEEKQHEEWTRNVEKTFLTPTEFIEEWFSDIFRQNPQELVTKGELTEQEWTIIEPFYKLFDSFAGYFFSNEDKLPADLTTNEMWRAIMRSAHKTAGELKDIGWSLADG